jgi:hypothetical protein
MLVPADGSRGTLSIVRNPRHHRQEFEFSLLKTIFPWTEDMARGTLRLIKKRTAVEFILRK